MDKLTSALENGELMVGVFWDFAKVCDTTNHHIYLINHITIVYVELHFHGSTILYMIIISFFFTYNGIKSLQQLIKCGVPQGTIRGPLLALIHINGPNSVCKRAVSIILGDDTNTFLISDSNLNTLQNLINKKLSHLAAWLKANKISLNLKKVHYTFYTKNMALFANLDDMIDNDKIVEAYKTIFLVWFKMMNSHGRDTS